MQLTETTKRRTPDTSNMSDRWIRRTNKLRRSTSVVSSDARFIRSACKWIISFTPATNSRLMTREKTVKHLSFRPDPSESVYCSVRSSFVSFWSYSLLSDKSTQRHHQREKKRKKSVPYCTEHSSPFLQTIFFNRISCFAPLSSHLTTLRTHTRTCHRLCVYIQMPMRLIISANRRHKLAPLWFSLRFFFSFSSSASISLAEAVNVDEKQNRSRTSWRFVRRFVLRRSLDGSCVSWRTSEWRRRWDNIRWSSPRTTRETFAIGREWLSPESFGRQRRRPWSTKWALPERRQRRTWSSSRWRTRAWRPLWRWNNWRTLRPRSSENLLLTGRSFQRVNTSSDWIWVSSEIWIWQINRSNQSDDWE